MRDERRESPVKSGEQDRIYSLIKVTEAFRAFFESLAFHELPKTLDGVLPRETSFYIIAEMLARATEWAFPSLLSVMGGEKGVALYRRRADKDPFEAMLIHNECHSRMKEAIGGPIAVFEAYRRSRERIELVTKNCPFKSYMRKNPLICASCLGVVLGVARYTFRDTPITIVRTQNELRYVRPGNIVIRQKKRSGECRIEVFRKKE